MSSKGDLLHTAVLSGVSYEFRRGPLVHPIIVWIDGRVLAHAEHGSLITGDPVPLLKFDVKFLLLHNDHPVWHALAIRRIVGQIWQKEACRRDAPSTSAGEVERD